MPETLHDLIFQWGGGGGLKRIVEEFSLVLYCRALVGGCGRKETNEFLKIESEVFGRSLTLCFARLALGC